MSDYIVCGKLDNCANLAPFSRHASAKVRLYDERSAPNMLARSLRLSACEHGVWFEGRLWDLEVFLPMAVTRGARRLLVLTNRERLYIVERAAAHQLAVDVFEADFPIFPAIKYNPCLRINLDVLTAWASLRQSQQEPVGQSFAHGGP
jgi:hypothetical protein